MSFETLDKWKTLIELIEGGSDPTSPVFEREKLRIQVIAAMDLENRLRELRRSINRSTKSMEDNAKSSENLARKVYWLNVILTAATVLVALVAATELARPWLA